MDKAFLLEQLGERMRNAAQAVHRTHREAREDARSGAARAVNLALGQGLRNVAARSALDALDSFRPRAFGSGQPIGLGAVVEVEDTHDGSGRTLFVAPVGAGEELSGPGGDGFFQVVTPGSPFGQALMGKRRGDVVEVTVHGELTEWTVTYVA